MKISNKIQYTLFLRYFGLLKIPLIFFVKPSVQHLDDQSVIIKIPFRRRTKNHLNSMYFGAMSIGADLAAGFLAFIKIREQNLRVSLIFKNFNAGFYKRAEDHTYFTCNEGLIIDNLIKKSMETDERVEETIKVKATVPAKFGDEPVAEFSLTLSLKKY